MCFFLVYVSVRDVPSPCGGLGFQSDLVSRSFVFLRVRYLVTFLRGGRLGATEVTQRQPSRKKKSWEWIQVSFDASIAPPGGFEVGGEAVEAVECDCGCVCGAFLERSEAVKVEITAAGIPTMDSLLFKDSQLQVCEVRSTISPDACTCARCQGKKVSPEVTSSKCKWQRAHVSYMRQHGLCSRAVGNTYKMTHIGTPRQRHLIAIVHHLNKKIQNQGGKPFALVNISQNVHRCTMSRRSYLPTITPGTKLYHVTSDRLLTAEEAMLFMCFDLSTLDIGSLSVNEIASLAGNAMHVRMIGLALLLALALVDTSKFKTDVSKSQIKGRKSKLVGALHVNRAMHPMLAR